MRSTVCIVSLTERSVASGKMISTIFVRWLSMAVDGCRWLMMADR
jgi:hypothetical protein